MGYVSRLEHQPGKFNQQFIGEMLVLTTLGFIPGILIAIQFPLLHAFDIENEVYLLSMLCSVIVIYALVFISSFIPSIQAVKTQPGNGITRRIIIKLKEKFYYYDNIKKYMKRFTKPTKLKTVALSNINIEIATGEFLSNYGAIRLRGKVLC